jgi:hypothetical protein
VISRAGELARRLAREAEAVCRHYLSNGKRQGRYWVVGDAQNTRGGSLYIRLHGPDYGPGAAGRWTDAATSEHGDLLDLIGLNRGLTSLGATMDEAAAFLALPRTVAPSQVSPEPRRRAEAARRLFAAARPVPGTLAEAYLRARGITVPLDFEALRFHPSVYYRENAEARLQVWPALLAAVTDRDGAVTGILRTFLDPRQHAKASLANPRRALGNLLGHGVRFGNAKHVVVAGEGIETMLALKSALPWLPMIAALSAHHLAALEFDPNWQRLYVAADNDSAGDRAAEHLKDRSRDTGLEVHFLLPRCDDFNTDLLSLGGRALRTKLIPKLNALDRDPDLMSAPRRIDVPRSDRNTSGCAGRAQ